MTSMSSFEIVKFIIMVFPFMMSLLIAIVGVRLLAKSFTIIKNQLNEISDVSKVQLQIINIVIFAIFLIVFISIFLINLSLLTLLGLVIIFSWLEYLLHKKRESVISKYWWDFLGKLGYGLLLGMTVLWWINFFMYQNKNISLFIGFILFFNFLGCLQERNKYYQNLSK